MDTTQGTLRIYTYVRGINYPKRVLVDSVSCDRETAQELASMHRNGQIGDIENHRQDSPYQYVWRADSVYL